MVIKPTETHKLIEDVPNETYKLVFSPLKMEDEGLYTLTATNTEGTSSQQTKMNIHSMLIKY